MNAPFTHTLWPAGLNWLAVFDFCAAGIANQASKEEFFYSKRGIPASKLPFLARNGVYVRSTSPSCYAQLGGNWKISSDSANQASRKTSFLVKDVSQQVNCLSWQETESTSILHTQAPTPNQEVTGKIQVTPPTWQVKKTSFLIKEVFLQVNGQSQQVTTTKLQTKKPAPQKELA